MSPRERLFALEQFGIKLGLDNIRTLLGALKDPERAFAAVHVAGTNGKGSVTAMVEHGLRAAGYRTGRYTSPHLAHIEERVAIDGAAVDAATFDAAAADVLQAVDDLLERGVLRHPPTFFEATTALAFEIFRRERVQVAVIEVGLGGRFDATNVLSPIVTAITSIALDHERHLGDSIARIAFEKAGILKPGVPVVIGQLVPDARRIVEETAQAVGAPVVEAAEGDYRGTPIALGLAGAHQHENAAIAATVLNICASQGLSVRREHLVAALRDVVWPARLEWLRRAGGGDVLLDAAHNPAGAAALAEYMRATTGPLPMVLGVMRDKDVDGVLRALAPASSRIVATQVASDRALEAEALAARVRALAPALAVRACASPASALETALDGNPRAVVAGSIFLVGPLRDRLLREGAATVRYPSGTPPFLLA